MCDVVSKALNSGASRRQAIVGALGGAALAGLAAVGTAPPATAAQRQPLKAKNHRTKLVLLGTAGGPPWWPGQGEDRAGIASAIVVGDRYYLVDVGEGVGPRLRQAGLGDGLGVVQNGPLRDLRAIFLTHLHSDHVSDINNILNSGLHNGLQRAPEKIQVWGPGNRRMLPPLAGEGEEPPVVAPENPTPGTKEMLELMVRTFATDYNDRARDNRFPVPDQLFSGHDVPIPERYLQDPNGNPHPRMSPIPFYEDDRVKVSATLVMHAPVFPALAFRFDTEDGSIVISGDTGASENLVQLAEGADVLAHEVIDRQWAESLFPQPRDAGAEGLYQHMVQSHTPADEVGPLAERAGVKTLVLHHLVPGDGAPNDWNEARRGFSGRMIVGQDLDEIGVGRPRTNRRPR